MWHSLEHVHDPVATLRSAFQLLVPGGLLLVAVPNVESAPARWFGADWFGLDLPRHLTHFSKATLGEMLAVSGFEVRNIRGIKHSDWLRSSAKLALRRSSKSLFSRALTWKPAAKLAAWMTYVTGRCDCLLAIGTRPSV
jgi:2-polyprenyl-3-methyl-5-hydroxy-6-metoxy-1,4-benzoquinol methylase